MYQNNFILSESDECYSPLYKKLNVEQVREFSTKHFTSADEFLEL